MKYKSKLLLLFFLLLSGLMLWNAKPIYAGGTFECILASSGGGAFGSITKRCVTASTSISCTADSQPKVSEHLKCEDYGSTDCPVGTHECYQTAQPTSPLSCSWAPLQNSSSPYNGQPAFCVGGFSSVSELQSYKVKMACEGWWCGAWGTRAWNWVTGGASQEFSLASCSVGGTTCDIGTDGSGKYFTCITGDFSSAIKDTIIAEIAKRSMSECLPSIDEVKVNGAEVIIEYAEPKPECKERVAKLQADIKPRLRGELISPAKSECDDRFNVRLSATGEVEPVPGTFTSLGDTPICTFAANIGKQGECETCKDKAGVWTPFGCIEANPQRFVAQILEIAIGIGGGLAFLMIIYGGFVIMTSSGNPEKLNGGKEIVTSAIAGLLLIVFSVVILKIIGIDILKIPGL